MLQASDNAPKNAQSRRADWIALLARAPIDLLESTQAYTARFNQHFLRQPETGLMMIQARAGGTGARFNLGEVTVTRCAIRVKGLNAPETVGVAYVLGRSHRKAQLAAFCDALLQIPELFPALDASLLEPIRQHLVVDEAARNAQAASTRVDFLTVAREAGSTGMAPSPA